MLTKIHDGRLHIEEAGASAEKQHREAFGYSSDTQSHLDGLLLVPASHQRFLARQKVEIYSGNQPTPMYDDLGYLKDKHPGGYAPGKTWMDCGGACIWAKPGRMVGRRPGLVSPTKIVLGKNSLGASVNVAGHEAGHALDEVLGDPGGWSLSDDQAFTKIHDRFSELGGYDVSGREWASWHGDPYYLASGHDGDRGAARREFFAETYAAWCDTIGRPSKYRAEELMHAVGAFTQHSTKPESGGPRRRATMLSQQRQVRQMGAELIAFYDGLDARIKEKRHAYPPPHVITPAEQARRVARKKAAERRRWAEIDRKFGNRQVYVLPAGKAPYTLGLWQPATRVSANNPPETGSVEMINLVTGEHVYAPDFSLKPAKPVTVAGHPGRWFVVHKGGGSYGEQQVGLVSNAGEELWVQAREIAEFSGATAGQVWINDQRVPS
jgi:hypothetical protein